MRMQREGRGLAQPEHDGGQQCRNREDRGEEREGFDRHGSFLLPSGWSSVAFRVSNRRAREKGPMTRLFAPAGANPVERLDERVLTGVGIRWGGRRGAGPVEASGVWPGGLNGSEEVRASMPTDLSRT